jgi:hypothetical protein
MKKIITLLLFIVVAQRGFTQITIRQSDLPTANQRWVTYLDYTDTDFTLTGSSGIPQQWDYSASFKTIDDTNIELYESTGSVPYSDLFPDATMGSNETTFEKFYKTDSDGFYYLGTHISSSLNNYDTLQYWNPEYLLMPVPLSYDDSRRYLSKSVVTGYDSSISQYVRSVTFRNSLYYGDAYGSLVTPVLSNANVLRVENTELEYDTTYSSATINGTYTVFDTSNYNTNYYYFVTNAPQLLLMAIDIDNKTLVLNSASYSYVTSEGINKLPAKSPVFTNVFPNPSHAVPLTFTFDNSHAHQLKIYNMTGECVETENIDNLNSLTISNKFLISGLYFYQVIDKAGQVLDGKKFILQ